MPSTSPELTKIIELAQRMVRTPEGSRLYGKPIGTMIDADLAKKTPTSAPQQTKEAETVKDAPKATDEAVDKEAPEERPVTLERLKSLQALAKAAVRTGDKSQVKKLEHEFNIALAKYSEGRTAREVLQELKAPISRKKS